MKHHPTARDETGSAIVEFVIVFPIFLFLILAIASYSIMFSFRQTLSQAASEGARAAAVATLGTSAAARTAKAKSDVEASFSGSKPLTCENLSGSFSSGHPFDCAITDVPAGCSEPTSTVTDCHFSVKLTYSDSYASTAQRQFPVLHFVGKMLPFAGFALPSTITYTAAARVR